MAIFEPSPNDVFVASGQHYQVQPHPQYPYLAYGQEAGKAYVYQVRQQKSGSLFALKIFKPIFRTSAIQSNTQAIAQYATLQGMRACNRLCLTTSADSALLIQYPDLEYSVIMPWIQGSTWFDIVYSKTPFSRDASLTFASLTASALASLENHGLAHCDISSGNVVLDLAGGNDVQLIDVEDLFGPGLPRPSHPSIGTPGYAHQWSRNSPDGQWHVSGDRFSGAVLLAEMICWHDLQFRERATGEAFFTQTEIHDPQSTKYRYLLNVLDQVSKKLTALFEKAWYSQSLDQCPSLTAWSSVLDQVMRPTPVIAWEPIPAPPPPLPIQYSGPITWQDSSIQFDPFPTTAPSSSGYSPTFKPLDSPSESDRLPIDFIPIDIGSQPSVSQAPPLPPLLQVSRLITPGMFSLIWVASQGDQHFEVQESCDSLFTTSTVLAQLDTTHFVVQNASPGNHYYRVRAVYKSGVGSWSNTVHVKI